MAKTCSWCGNQIGFTDMAYDWVELESKGHWICGKCCGNIASVKKGLATFDGIKTDRTDPELFHHFAKQEEKSEEVIQYEKKKQEQQRLKEEAQQVNPLFEDIHQIAGDLRFIKNYLIFSIIVGVIWGLIYITSLL